MPEVEHAMSVLLPVRDGRETIRPALLDLASSLGPADELLVIDDGSADGTTDVLRGFGESEPRLRIIRTDGLGLVGALNLGLREVTHQWVARADADDRYPRKRLSDQRAAIAEGVVLVTGDYRIFSGARQVGDIPCALTAPFVATSLIHPQRVPHPGVLFDARAVLSVGGYRQEDFPAEDLGLWLRLAGVGNFVGVPAPVVDWAMNPGSVTHSQQEAQRRTTDRLLRTCFPSHLIKNVTVDDVEKELAAYRGTRLESARKLLLVRDLHALRSRGVSDDAYQRVRGALTATPVRMMGAVRDLALDQWRRKLIRGSFSPAKRY